MNTKPIIPRNCDEPGFASLQSCHRSGLEIADLKLDPAKILPLGQPRGECQAAMAALRHELVEPVTHAKADGAIIAAPLAHPEAHMSIARADAAWLAHHLQTTREKQWLWIARAERLQIRHVLDQAVGQAAQRQLRIEHERCCCGVRA